MAEDIDPRSVLHLRQHYHVATDDTRIELLRRTVHRRLHHQASIHQWRGNLYVTIPGMQGHNEFSRKKRPRSLEKETYEEVEIVERVRFNPQPELEEDQEINTLALEYRIQVMPKAEFVPPLTEVLCDSIREDATLQEALVGIKIKINPNPKEHERVHPVIELIPRFGRPYGQTVLTKIHDILREYDSKEIGLGITAGDGRAIDEVVGYSVRRWVLNQAYDVYEHTADRISDQEVVMPVLGNAHALINPETGESREYHYVGLLTNALATSDMERKIEMYTNAFWEGGSDEVLAMIRSDPALSEDHFAVAFQVGYEKTFSFNMQEYGKSFGQARILHGISPTKENWHEIERIRKLM